MLVEKQISCLTRAGGPGLISSCEMRPVWGTCAVSAIPRLRAPDPAHHLVIKPFMSFVIKPALVV